MKTTVFKHVQIILFVELVLVLTLILCNVLSPFNVTLAYADADAPSSSASSTTTSFDDSPVIEDLLSSTISGKPFDVVNYPYNENAGAQIISLNEYCYSYRANQMDQYALYIYVYNPCGKTINAEGSRIQLATAWDSNWNATEYKRFSLEFCSKSEGEYADLFYKLKLTASEYFKNVMIKQSSERHYSVSGIQLNYEDSALGGVEIRVAMEYTFTGFAKGYGPNVAESTLTCTSSHMEEVLHLNVEDCFWKVDGASALGKGHQDQINSVYFAVPRETLEKHGTLYGVSAEWYEYKTKEILVTNDHNSDGMYYQIYKYLGVPVSEIPDNDTYSIVSTGKSSTPLNSSVTLYTYDWGFNYDESKHGNVFTKFAVDDECQELYYAFLVNDLKNDAVDGDKILKHIQDYTAAHPDDKMIYVSSEKMTTEMFENDVDAGHTRGYNYAHIDNSGNYNYDLRGYDDTHSTWDRWMDYGLFTKVNTSYNYDIKPIVEVEYSAIDTLSDDAISSQYLVDKSQVAEFKNYVKTFDDDYVTWLFRFSATDYYSFDVVDMTGDAHGYVAQTTLFADFKVIDLTFVNDDVYTVIPVVQNPIDIIGDASQPIQDENYTIGELIKKGFNDVADAVTSWWDKVEQFFKERIDLFKRIGIIAACVVGAGAIVWITISIVRRRKKQNVTNNYYYKNDNSKNKRRK